MPQIEWFKNIEKSDIQEIEFSQIDSKLKELLLGSYQDIDEDMMFMFEDAFWSMEEQDKKIFLDVLNWEQSSFFAFSLLDSMPIDSKEQLKLLLKSIELENKEDQKDDITENTDGITENIENDKKDILNKEDQEIEANNNSLISKLDWDFEKYKEQNPKKIEGIRKTISQNNLELNEKQLDVYTDTFVLLDNQQAFLEKKPELKSSFDNLMKISKENKVFSNIVISSKIDRKKFSNKQINKVLLSNTSQWWAIDFDWERLKVWKQEYVFNEDWSLEKSFVSENWKMKLPVKIEYKADYALIAQKAKIKRSIKDVDSKISRKKDMFEELKASFIKEQENLKVVDEGLLKDSIEIEMENIKKEVEKINLEVLELIKFKDLLTVDFNNLVKEEKQNYLDSIGKQKIKDKLTREALMILESLGLPRLWSGLNQIFEEMRTGMLIPDLWKTINPKNIDLASKNFWEFLTEDNDDMFEENIVRFTNKVYFWNPKWKNEAGEFVWFSIETIKRNEAWVQTKSDTEIAHILKSQWIISENWTFNINKVRENLKKPVEDVNKKRDKK